jgi:uncharacterized protein
MARVRLPIIDADGHVFEPFAMWPERLPAEFHDRMWRRVRDDQGHEQVLFHGRPTNMEWTVGTLCTPGGLSAQTGALDLDLDTDVDRGVDDPARRVALMDEQGIAVSVLFPTMTLGLDDIPEVDFRHAYAHAYNSWIADFCGHDPVRLRWAAVLPLADVEWTVRELELALDAGATTVMLSPIPTPDRRNLGSADLDPLWARLQEAGMPAVVHASNPGSPSLGMHKLWANRTQWHMGVPFQLAIGVMYVLDGGVLERFPRLEIGFFEGDVGWLPHWLGRLDEAYDKMALVSIVPARSAVEQFRAQCVISGEPADRGLALTVDLVGADRVLFASDWPHQDGAWPDPVAILRDRDDLTDAQKRAMFVDGPVRFYRIDLDEVLAHLGDGWRADAEMAVLAGMIPAAV